MKNALLRYRVMAYIVSVLLVALFFYAMPMDYIWHNDTPTAIIGTAHGWLYVLYLISAFVLSRKVNWTLKQTLLVLLAGTIPVVSFFAERWVTRKVKPELAKAA